MHSTPAIYHIFNTVTWKVYVGSAVNALQRWNAHRRQLNRGLHHSRYLQAAWNKYGPDAFEFDVIEVVECKQDLVVREQYHLDAALADGWCYNTSPSAGNCLGVKHTTETRAKMSLAQRLRPPPSAETRAKTSRAQKGKVLSAEHRAKLALANTGKPLSAEHRSFRQEVCK